MRSDLFEALTREWPTIVASAEARRAVTAWAADPALTEIRTLDDVIELTAKGSAPASANAVLLALVRRAADDSVAARAALQALLPGLRGVTFRMGGGHDDDIAADVIAAAWSRIRTYPCDRRLERVAANVVLDVLHEIWMQRLARRAERPCSPESFLALGEPELFDSLGPDARDVLEGVEGQVPSAQLRLIADAVFERQSAADAARDAGITVKAMERRRDRARVQVVKAFRRVSSGACAPSIVLGDDTFVEALSA